ncbi:MAG: hypothetical protein LBE18_11685 [Planctomycetaceae bacterium]|jgi:hypothetical protein|nr:hypothetical protein [Planctomycetaceae bacterium]
MNRFRITEFHTSELSANKGRESISQQFYRSIRGTINIVIGVTISTEIFL